MQAGEAEMYSKDCCISERARIAFWWIGSGMVSRSVYAFIRSSTAATEESRGVFVES
jgi:hypothetical protein